MKKFILVPVPVVIAAEAAWISSHAYKMATPHHQHLGDVAIAAAVFVADVAIAIARRARGSRTQERPASGWERIAPYRNR